MAAPTAQGFPVVLRSKGFQAGPSNGNMDQEGLAFRAGLKGPVPALPNRKGPRSTYMVECRASMVGIAIMGWVSGLATKK